MPTDQQIPHMLASSDVLGTGYYAAEAAGVTEGSTAVVVGDGAVGLMAVLSAKLRGADRIIAMGRHESRQKLAREYGATDIVAARGEERIAELMELTNGVGADAVLECVGLKQSMDQALGVCRPGGAVGFVGVPHEVTFSGGELFFARKRLFGGPAPMRRYLPDLMQRILEGEIAPGKAFDLELPVAEVADGYRAIDERRAIKTLLRVCDPGSLRRPDPALQTAIAPPPPPLFRGAATRGEWQRGRWFTNRQSPYHACADSPAHMAVSRVVSTPCGPRARLFAIHHDCIALRRATSSSVRRGDLYWMRRSGSGLRLGRRSGG